MTVAERAIVGRRTGGHRPCREAAGRQCRRRPGMHPIRSRRLHRLLSWGITTFRRFRHGRRARISRIVSRLRIQSAFVISLGPMARPGSRPAAGNPPLGLRQRGRPECRPLVAARPLPGRAWQCPGRVAGRRTLIGRPRRLVTACSSEVLPPVSRAPPGSFPDPRTWPDQPPAPPFARKSIHSSDCHSASFRRRLDAARWRRERSHRS